MTLATYWWCCVYYRDMDVVGWHIIKWAPTSVSSPVTHLILIDVTTMRPLHALLLEFV